MSYDLIITCHYYIHHHLSNMLNLLSNTIKAYNSTGYSLLRDLEEENIRNEAFFREI